MHRRVREIFHVPLHNPWGLTIAMKKCEKSQKDLNVILRRANIITSSKFYFFLNLLSLLIFLLGDSPYLVLTDTFSSVCILPDLNINILICVQCGTIKNRKKFLFNFFIFQKINRAEHTKLASQYFETQH